MALPFTRIGLRAWLRVGTPPAPVSVYVLAGALLVGGCARSPSWTGQDASPDEDAARDSGPDARARDGTAGDGCAPHVCTAYTDCSQYATCDPCPEPPPGICNGRDDDCDSNTPEEGEALDCPTGQTCRRGTCCADECPSEGLTECTSGDTAHHRCVVDGDQDPCLEWSAPVTCQYGCTNGRCNSCSPNCGGKECGDDGCGGWCGSCLAGQVCDNGLCVCDGRMPTNWPSSFTPWAYNPILVASSDTSLQGQDNVYAPDIHHDPDGRWLMWYGAQGSDGHDRISFIWLAVGSDHTHFLKDREVLGPGPVGSCEEAKVGRPSVLLENGVFKMWFDGTDASGRRCVGLATWPDGRNFTEHPDNPILCDAGAVDVEHVGGVYVMLWEGGDGTYWATSVGGVCWAAHGRLFGLSGADYDRYGQVTPFLEVANGVVRAIWFRGPASPPGTATASPWPWRPGPRSRRKGAAAPRAYLPAGPAPRPASRGPASPTEPVRTVGAATRHDAAAVSTRVVKHAPRASRIATKLVSERAGREAGVPCREARIRHIAAAA